VLPRVETLEDRTVPSTLVVRNNHDSGPGSLRDTLGAAANGDSIVFADSLDGKTIKLTSGQLVVTNSLKVVGPGADDLTISGNEASRVFDITGGATVTISSLTISHGLANSAGSGGGGILSETGATLILDHDTFSHNQAVGAAGLDEFGGGLLNLGLATVNKCTFKDNQVLGGGSFDAIGGSAGGAIDNFGGASLTVVGTLFSDNRVVSADGDGYFALGGAVENNAGVNGYDPTLATPSTATLTDCTFLDNLAQGGAHANSNGGAILSEGLGTYMALTDCLVSGNLSQGGEGGANEGIGGGVMNIGIMDITDCTITDNEAEGGNDGILSPGFPGQYAGAAFGGGVANNSGTDLHITDSLISGNIAQGAATASGPGGDAFGGGITNSPGGTMTMTDSSVSDNGAFAGPAGAGTAVTGPAGIGFGGGIDTTGTSTTTLVGCTIAHNLAQGSAGSTGNNGGTGMGGGLGVGGLALLGSVDNSQLTVTDCTVVHNQAVGGVGGTGANGGDGLGGGLAITTGSSATLNDSSVEHNDALGGAAGAGGSDGHGVRGGVYNLGTFSFDAASVIKHNHASTSNDDIGP
jgi:hypothetical protein